MAISIQKPAVRRPDDRKAGRPITHLAGFKGSAGGWPRRPRALAERGMCIRLCWAHVRRRFQELAVAGRAPIPGEVLERLAERYAVETEIRGCEDDEGDAEGRVTIC